MAVKSYQPSSKILILTICSFTKRPGGTNAYDEQDAIVSRLSAKARSILLKNREDAWYLVKLAKEIDWQGIPAEVVEWRYRMGDYRLIYLPDEEKQTSFLLAVGPRGSVYDD